MRCLRRVLNNFLLSCKSNIQSLCLFHFITTTVIPFEESLKTHVIAKV